MRKFLILAQAYIVFAVPVPALLAGCGCGNVSLHAIGLLLMRAMIKVIDTTILVELHTS